MSESVKCNHNGCCGEATAIKSNTFTREFECQRCGHRFRAPTTISKCGICVGAAVAIPAVILAPGLILAGIGALGAVLLGGDDFRPGPGPMDG